jgi:hypothetical protein
MNESSGEVRTPSVRRVRLIEDLCAASEARERGTQTLHYAPRDFVLVGLPYRAPKSPGVYERRNGKFRLRIIADPELGVPRGQDRIVILWLASAYRAQGCPEDRTIVFRSAGDILRCYGVESSGRTYVRLRERIERICATTFMVWDDTPGSGLSRPVRAQARVRGDGDGVLRFGSYRLVEQAHLWFQRRARLNQHTLWQNTITLTPEFARDVKDNAVPIDLDTVSALKTYHAALDLYVWQCYRSWRLAYERRHSIRVAFRGPAGLIAQLGTQCARERQAIQLIRESHDMVLTVWPQCPNTLTDEGIIVRPAEAIRGGAKLVLPGVMNPPASPRLPAVETSPGLLLYPRRK